MDVLLGDKLELARACGAEVDSSLVLPRPCGVSDLDWCVIFANALDNAIQACAGMEGTTSIRMAGEQQGSFYLLEFENTCLPKASPAMGTGLSNIKTVAEKSGGAMTFETSGALSGFMCCWTFQYGRMAFQDKCLEMQEWEDYNPG